MEKLGKCKNCGREFYRNIDEEFCNKEGGLDVKWFVGKGKEEQGCIIICDCKQILGIEIELEGNRIDLFMGE